MLQTTLRGMLSLSLIGALLLGFAVQTSAQVTTSAMSGKITDDKGEALIGATVVAVHTPSGTRYGTTTNVDGTFYISALRSGGPYRVDITYTGYSSLQDDNIT